jgi:hypothetical protein
MVDCGPYATQRWLLHTKGTHGLYEQFGFHAPSHRLMERGE